MGKRANGILQGDGFGDMLGLQDTFATFLEICMWQVPQELEIVTELQMPHLLFSCLLQSSTAANVRPRNQMGKLEKKKILERHCIATLEVLFRHYNPLLLTGTRSELQILSGFIYVISN